MNKRQLGHQQELVAKSYLKQQGYKVLALNYYTPFGELDIVASKKQCLAIVEVKYRKRSSLESPGQAITKTKQTRLIKSAQHYLLNHRINYQQISFDVIAIQDDHILDHIQNAFRADQSII